VTIGYSGHEAPDNTEVAVAAVSKGARLLERHFGVPTDDIKLNAYSMNPQEADAWIAAAERSRAILGANGDKHVSQAEVDSLVSLQRGVYAKRPIVKGTEIGDDDVFFAMPCQNGQLSSGEFGQLRANFKASRDYARGEAVSEHSGSDPISHLRGILHDAKGQIFEAGIVLGKDYTIEISHHYRLEQFRQTGCIIVNLVNREYCEKLLIVLPSQNHPQHCHRKKEETFRVLWGELDIELNGNLQHLEAGDSLLIERGAMHGFSSVGGAIVQEVSTTHIVGDSYYKDPKVRELDPMQRKTILEEW
jgi:N-acetylneuraminate synthase